MGMERFICSICGHKYDPEKGEPLQGINPGIEFETLASDWSCPVCFAEKNKFSKE